MTELMTAGLLKKYFKKTKKHIYFLNVTEFSLLKPGFKCDAEKITNTETSQTRPSNSHIYCKVYSVKT